ncbi:contact-dependent growth inhibition system immunity protein [Rhizobium mesosinicum]|uniref:CdiI immunity protein domain-containing protein n=1 Tax=Rhizobium mesosinicum TaxID=335017 RepID=A0ABS7H314_9HYPH|nr:contact-dependent growth inhibition system immunity protein [Rhizobium mesosinicum]MBW9056675.1 hypothetical protein [Rhizobium mesosinicum]
MTERFEKLEQLMGGYFHQDWDIQGASDAEVIAAFRRAEPVNQIEATIAEIDHLLELVNGDPLKIEKILAALGCEYDYQALGLNGQVWLQRVHSLLLSSEPQPPASPSSI